MAAAVGSLMMRKTFMPEMVPASCHWTNNSKQKSSYCHYCHALFGETHFWFGHLEIPHTFGRKHVYTSVDFGQVFTNQSLVDWRWASLKYAGTVTTACFTSWTPSQLRCAVVFFWRKGDPTHGIGKNKAWWVTCDTKFIRVALQEVITVMCAFLMDSPTRQWRKMAFKSHFTRENPHVLLSFIIGKCTQRWTQKNLENHECKTTPAPSTNGFLTKSAAFKLKNIDKYFEDHLWNFKLEVVKRSGVSFPR